MSSEKYKLLLVFIGTFFYSISQSFGQNEVNPRDSMIHSAFGKKYGSIQNNLDGYYTVYSIEKDKYGLIDSLGNEVLAVIYDEVGYVGDEMVFIAIEGKAGYINLVNKKIIQGKYIDHSIFHDGYAVVSQKGKDSLEYHGVIDKKGKTIIPFKYQSIGNSNGVFYEDKACVCAYNDAWRIKCGFVDRKSKIVIPLIYDDFKSKFVHGIAIVKKDNLFGGINEKGDTILPFKYRNVRDFQLGLAVVTSEGGIGLMDTLGKEVIPCMYKEIGYYNEKIVVVKNLNNIWGIINMQNQALSEFKYVNELHFENGRSYINTIIGEVNRNIYLLMDGTEIIE